MIKVRNTINKENNRKQEIAKSYTKKHIKDKKIK